MYRLAIPSTLEFSANTPLIFGADAPSSADNGASSATKDSAWLEKARAEYPPKTCVVTGEDHAGNGDMAEAKDLNYKQPGKPFRLFRFCWKKCQSEFEKDPTQYLKPIDEATAKATMHG